jgi:hypothetical protein
MYHQVLKTKRFWGFLYSLAFLIVLGKEPKSKKLRYEKKNDWWKLSDSNVNDGVQKI